MAQTKTRRRMSLRGRTVLSAIARAPRNIPVTVTFLAFFWALGAAGVILFPQVTLHAVAASASRLAAQPWALIASGFWARGPAGYLTGSLAVLSAGMVAERRLGAMRLAAAGLAVHVTGVLAASIFAWSVRGLMGTWAGALASGSFVGPTAMAFGTLMAATATMETLWRRRLRLTVMTVLMLLALYSGSFPDLVRLGAAITGTFLGPLLAGRRPSFSFPVATRREARVLIALVTAATAVGPVIAGLLPHAIGPLSVLRYLFTNIQPVDPQTLPTLCTDPHLVRVCAAARLQLRAGAGGIFMSILPSVLLLVFADGLRRGRRAAWWGSIAVSGAMTALAVTYILGVLIPAPSPQPPHEGLGPINLTDFRHPLGLVLPLLQPLAVLILLTVTRRLFAVSAPSGTYRRAMSKAAATGFILAVAYVIIGMALNREFNPSPSPTGLIADVPDRFLPLGYAMDVPPAFFPESTPAVILYEGVGTIFWLVASYLFLASYLRPAHQVQDTDADRARSILHAEGRGTLSWMTTWPGNTYWFSSTGTSFIAYRVRSGVALTLGPPVGPDAELRPAIAGFARFCETNGWSPCLYAVPDHVRETAAASGWNAVEVATDTVLPLDGLTFSGRQFQDIRTAINKAARNGIRAEWTTYRKAGFHHMSQIQALSEEWVADRNLPEMEFTLGGLDELDDPEVRCLLAIDDKGTIHAATSWLPVHEQGRVIGWTLDFMRRRTDGFGPVIDFLIASAALSLKGEGCRFISLSAAPLARPAQAGVGDPRPPAPALQQVLETLGTRLEPVYGFRSLLAFKAKFHPVYTPLYLLYTDSAALPAIANAISGAYLPGLTLPQKIGIFTRLIRPRITK